MNAGLCADEIDRPMKALRDQSDKEWAHFKSFLLAVLMNAACSQSKPFPLAALTAMHELGSQQVSSLRASSVSGPHVADVVCWCGATALMAF